MTKPLVFVDVESTGLDPVRHELWEVGVVLRIGGLEDYHRWFLKPQHLETAEPEALAIGGYYERHPEGDHEDPNDMKAERCASAYGFATEFEKMTRGATLVGANTRFDERMLGDFLRAHRVVPGWHYRLCDVENMVQGYMGLDRPIGLAKCANVMEITHGYEAHTALDDARLTRDVYDRVLADPFGRRQ